MATQPIATGRDGGAAARSALERTIASGGVALFPADGLYGLACDPLNPEAIGRIDAIKGRDQGKPSAVMYFSPLAVREILLSLGGRTREAIAALLPDALTLVVANPGHRYPLACRENPERLGIRLIEGPLTGAICPILQTSANRAGDAPPYRFEDISPEILDLVDLAIDGGELTGLRSTVVDLTAIETGGEPVVLREGGYPAARLIDRISSLS